MDEFNLNLNDENGLSDTQKKIKFTTNLLYLSSSALFSVHRATEFKRFAARFCSPAVRHLPRD